MQVAVLFVAERRNREVADRLDVGQILADLVEIALRELANVLAVIAVFGKIRRLPEQLRGARAYRKREILDLCAGVVVIELAFHGVALPFQQRRDCIAERRLASMANVQRAGRIRGHEFNDHTLASMNIAATEAVTEIQHARNDGSPLGWRQGEVDETGTRDFDVLDDIAERRSRGPRDGFCELARILPCAFGQIQRFGRCEIAVVGIARPLEGWCRIGDVGKFLADGAFQRLFDLLFCIDLHLTGESWIAATAHYRGALDARPRPRCAVAVQQKLAGSMSRATRTRFAGADASASRHRDTKRCSFARSRL